MEPEPKLRLRLWLHKIISALPAPQHELNINGLSQIGATCDVADPVDLDADPLLEFLSV